ncbi:MAG: prepilin-type N-terminal cleavage/methylation domain-containing protein, partial [Burkholderiaceae bacterium]
MRWRAGGAWQRGISLIELMVGITIGMIVVAGASVMAVNQLAEHRRLMLEIQVQQDLRAAADLMLRELRRSGAWAVPQDGVWAPGGLAAPGDNPYSGVVLSNGGTNASQIQYSYSRGTDRSSGAGNTNPDNNLVDSDERFGFRLSNGILQLRMGGNGAGNWQPLTDDKTLQVTALRISENLQSVDM